MGPAPDHAGAKRALQYQLLGLACGLWGASDALDLTPRFASSLPAGARRLPCAPSTGCPHACCERLRRCWHPSRLPPSRPLRSAALPTAAAELFECVVGMLWRELDGLPPPAASIEEVAATCLALVRAPPQVPPSGRSKGAAACTAAARRSMPARRLPLPRAGRSARGRRLRACVLSKEHCGQSDCARLRDAWLHRFQRHLCRCPAPLA